VSLPSVNVVELSDSALRQLRDGLPRLGQAVGRQDVAGRMIHVGDLLVVATDIYETQKKHKYLAIWHEELAAYVARDLGDPEGDLGWYLNEPELVDFRVINSVSTGWLRTRHL